MDMDDVPKTHHPEDFAQLIELLKFLSDPIIYPPDGKMQDNISFEVFVNICDHLPPQDLFMLACVCKNFANMLNADLFPISSDIWKSSRERFTVFRDMIPPKGMSQKRFAQLLNFEKGCEVCKSKEKNVQIYWPAFVRSCKDCILERAKSAFELEQVHKIDMSIINNIPPLVPCPDDRGRTQYYWLQHVISAQKRLQTNSDEPDLELGSNEDNIELHLAVTRRWNEKVILQQNKVQAIVKELYEKKTLNTSEMFMNNPVIKNLMSKILINPFIEQDFQSFIEELKSVVKSGHSITDTTSSKDVKSLKAQKKELLRKYAEYEFPKKEKKEREASMPFSKYSFDYGTPPIRPMPPIIPNGHYMDTSGSQMNSIRQPMQSPQINPINAPPMPSFQMNPINTPITNAQMNPINLHVPHMSPQSRTHSQLVQRRQDIIKLLKNIVFTGTPKTKNNFVPFTVNINDPIFRFLDRCETFIDPPFFQPNDNTKYDIILKIKQEAGMLNEVHRGLEPRHILDVRGALERQLGNHPMFKCSMCPYNVEEGEKIQIYRKVVTHILKQHGLKDRQRLSSYIEVDPKSVVHYIHFAFIPEIRPKVNFK
ncbi:3696_t:CDS:2, partial [Scutellospora calospora]